MQAKAQNAATVRIWFGRVFSGRDVCEYRNSDLNLLGRVWRENGKIKANVVYLSDPAQVYATPEEAIDTPESGMVWIKYIIDSALRHDCDRA